MSNIVFNNTPINKAFIGSDEITSIYYGNTLVYSKKSQVHNILDVNKLIEYANKRSSVQYDGGVFSGSCSDVCEYVLGYGSNSGYGLPFIEEIIPGEQYKISADYMYNGNGGATVNKNYISLYHRGSRNGNIQYSTVLARFAPSDIGIWEHFESVFTAPSVYLVFSFYASSALMSIKNIIIEKV